ncbi:MAG: hypothetical protein V7L27_07855 [Nostoc sp.]|uniref:hypothetical protein n=1 Tax=Nostoc sp. TaxID=1180 RepID=UPI002FF4CA8F
MKGVATSRWRRCKEYLLPIILAVILKKASYLKLSSILNKRSHQEHYYSGYHAELGSYSYS